MPKLLVAGQRPSDDRARARSVRARRDRVVVVVVTRRAASAVRDALGAADCRSTSSSRSSRPGCSTRSCWRATGVRSGIGRAACWITWCDQIAHATCDARAAVGVDAAAAGAARWCCRPADGEPVRPPRARPRGRIVGVLHRREGDAMPARGETDAGVFDLSLRRVSAMRSRNTRRPGDRRAAPASAISCRSSPGSPRRGPVVDGPVHRAAKRRSASTRPRSWPRVEAHLRATRPDDEP